MGAGEAVTFGEGVALPTRIKFDMLPENELPRSSSASFTKNWSKDLTDDSFLQEVVNRWRAQTHNPDSTGYALEANPPSAATIDAPNSLQQPGFAPSSQLAAPPVQAPRPSLRRDTAAAASAAPTPQVPSFGQNRPAAPLTAPPPGRSPFAPTAPAPEQAQDGDGQSLASLIKQFRPNG
jgi:uncharacterized protein